MGNHQSWRDFKEQTAIHGFAEYDGMTSRLFRGIWVVLLVGLAVACCLQLYDLSKEYAGHKPTTTVQVSRSLSIPDFGIMLEAAKFLKDTPGDPRLRLTVALSSWLEYDNPCPDSAALGIQHANDHVSTDQNYDDEHSDNGDFEDASTDNITVEELRASFQQMMEQLGDPKELLQYYPTTDEIPQLNDDYRNKIPKHKELFVGVELFKRNSLKGRIVNSTARLNQGGPLYKLRTSAKSVNHVDSIRIILNNTFLSEYFYIVTGASVNWFDPMHMTELRRGDSFGLSVRFVHYDRSKRFCGADSVRERMTCEGHCAQQRARAGSGCFTYVGEKPLPSGPLCSFSDYSECLNTYFECEEECHECSTCKPCHEVDGIVSITGQAENASDVAGVTEIMIDFKEVNRVQRFTQVEASSSIGFVSQIGGILGLCFGISIVSVLHLFYSLAVLCFDFFQGRREYGD